MRRSQARSVTVETRTAAGLRAIGARFGLNERMAACWLAIAAQLGL